MAFCSNCGVQIREGSKFCVGCGAPVSAGSGTPAPAQPVYAQQPLPPQPFQQAAQQPQYIPAQPQQPAYQPQQPVYQPQQPVYQPQYAPPQDMSAMSEKQAVLFNAPGALNRADRPWEVIVEGDSIIARWKWMDATYFAPHEINDETRQFTFIVTLTDKRTWKELDKTENKSSGVKMSGGKLSFGSSSNSFTGKSNQKSFSFGVGKDNQTGEVGVIGFKFNTTDVKQPVRDYLTACGWKQAGMFG